MKVTETADGTVTVETGEHAAKGATWDGGTIATRVIKAEAERRYTLCVIYPADKADIATALDGHRDFASKAVVEDAAWNYMRNYRQVGIAHSPEHAASMGTAFKASDAADVVESYIYRGPDWVIKAAGAEVTVKAGDWLGGFVWSPEAWADIQAGRVNGVSVEGGAVRRTPSPEALANLRN